MNACKVLLILLSFMELTFSRNQIIYKLSRVVRHVLKLHVKGVLSFSNKVKSKIKH